MRKGFNWTISFILLLVLCTAGAASGAEVSIDTGNIIITDTYYKVGDTQTDWESTTPHKLTITGSGTHSANTISVESGICTLTLSNVEIISTDKPAISIHSAESGAGAKLILIVTGENELSGGKGCAGIEVQAGWDVNNDFSETLSGTLEIQGSGTITVTGGIKDTTAKLGAGAGIGGNGFGETAHINGGDFGVVYISEEFTGTLTAQGGSSDTWTCGSGAGIGGGGLYTTSGWLYCGNITICGGTISAIGGGTSGNGGGGAGIGTGAGNMGCNYENGVKISISGGKITAKGGSYGAGIGGGNNINGGTIAISGGEITASGFTPDNWQGGAGIGAGGNRCFTEITISGDANIKAYGSYHAPGIGGCVLPEKGMDDENVLLLIKDTATVLAYGGAGAPGLGIKDVIPSALDDEYGTVSIEITSSGNVIAIAGSSSMAIQSFADRGKDGTLDIPVSPLTIGENVKVWAFTPSTTKPAINWDTVEFTFIQDKVSAVGYTKPDGEEGFPAVQTDIEITNVNPDFVDTTCHTWKYEETTQAPSETKTYKIVLTDGKETVESEYFQNGNWAYFGLSASYFVTITIQKTDGGTLKIANTEYNNDDTLSVIQGGEQICTLTPDLGYKVGSVTFEGISIQPENDGTYKIIPQNSGILSVEFIQEEEEEDDGKDNEDEEEDGGKDNEEDNGKDDEEDDKKPIIPDIPDTQHETSEEPQYQSIWIQGDPFIIDRATFTDGGIAIFNDGTWYCVAMPAGFIGSVTITTKSDTDSSELDTYKLADIEVDGTIPAGSSAIIKFKILVSEIEAEGYQPNDVALYHFEGGQWVKLETTYEIIDGVAYYEASVGSFSPFAIVFEKDGASLKDKTESTEPTATQTEAESPLSVLAIFGGLVAVAVLRRR